MTPEQLLIILLAIITVDYFFDLVLEYMNLNYQQTELPEAVKGIYDEEKYRKSQEYHQTKTRFGFFTGAVNFALLFVVFALGIPGTLDGILGQHISDPILRALAFFGILYIASDLINIPFQVYNTFVIEEKFEFNKTTPKTFVLDKIKGYLLTAIIGGLLLGLLFFLIGELEGQFWVWFWAAITLFLLFTNMFYTSLILPLFNKLQPLEDGELKDKITAYCRKVGFPLTNLYVIDGSKRSTKANAFFSGFGKRKKIVLYDTLINNHTHEELVAVLAHEVGHYKKKHIIGNMLLAVGQVGLMLYILSLFVHSGLLSAALGSSTVSIPVNLLAFGILYTPISKVTGIIMSIFSRKNEYEADAYARETHDGEALTEALKKLSVNNLSNLTPHPAYVFVHYSHPPLLQRLEALHQN